MSGFFIAERINVAQLVERPVEARKVAGSRTAFTTTKLNPM